MIDIEAIEDEWQSGSGDVTDEQMQALLSEIRSLRAAVTLALRWFDAKTPQERSMLYEIGVVETLRALID